MEPEITQTTLPDRREVLSDAYDKAVADTPPSTDTPAPVEAAPKVEAPAETEAQKTERLRDEKGRFAEGKAPAKPAAVATPPEVQAQAAPAVVAPPRPARPSSWAKPYWEHWDKLDPQLAQYIHQRESEYAKGVSTYKGEYDRAKPIMDALAPHLPDFERMGINPAQQMARYAEIHKTLAMGNEQQRLGLFAQLVRDYKIPVEQMFVRGNDGQIYLNQQMMQQAAAQPAPQQAQQQPDIKQTVQQILAQERAVQDTQQFSQAKDASGNLLHPHFDTVRETMAQLLDAGVVKDIPSAYDMALKAPQHSDLYEQAQQQRKAQDEAEKQRVQKEAVERAKRDAVSVRSATPAKSAANGAKTDRRAVLEEAYEQHVVGRV